jgi:hypothetical protein
MVQTQDGPVGVVEKGEACAEVLNWDNPSSWKKHVEKGYDWVLGSDLVYGNEYLNLVGLLSELARARSNTRIMFGYEERDSHFPSPGFWPALKEVFDLQKIELSPEVSAKWGWSGGGTVHIYFLVLRD